MNLGREGVGQTNSEKHFCILIVYAESLKSFYYKIINIAPAIATLSLCDDNQRKPRQNLPKQIFPVT